VDRSRGGEEGSAIHPDVNKDPAQQKCSPALPPIMVQAERTFSSVAPRESQFGGNGA